MNLVGGGGFGGYSVPGSGQVIVAPYAPYTYTNMLDSGYYFTSQGVKFKMKKCYTIPPVKEHLVVSRIDPGDDGGGIIFKPAEGLEVIERAWSSPIVDLDDDYDKKEVR